jgi:hypothetical protein
MALCKQGIFFSFLCAMIDLSIPEKVFLFYSAPPGAGAAAASGAVVPSGTARGLAVTFFF